MLSKDMNSDQLEAVIKGELIQIGNRNPGARKDLDFVQTLVNRLRNALVREEGASR